VLERVAKFITRYSMFRSGERVGVAVSGGADSVCLLYALVELAPRWNLRLSVLHLNHGLRGAESDADEAFVGGTAERLGLRFVARRWDGAPHPRAGSPTPPNVEEAAREARLAFFKSAIADGEADKVALGHTRSDQAETVLFRLLRGAGSAGLAGIRPVTAEGIVRPLLGVERAGVEAFLRERGLPWRDDSTNASPVFARNRIRHELLPLLEREWNPAIRDTLANVAEWARAEEEYWAGEIQRLADAHLRPESGADPQVCADPSVPADSVSAAGSGIRPAQGPGGAVLVRAETLRCLPPAAARRLVRHAIERVRGNLRGIGFGHVEAVMEMALAGDGHGRFQAPGLDVYRSFDWLRIGLPGANTLENRNYRFPAPVPGRVQLPSGGAIFLELIDTTETSGLFDCVYNGVVGGLDWELLPGPLEWRNWRPGDRYQPAGNSGAEKIKTLFQAARVPLWERRHWPVLTHGDVIVWARRFGPAARYAASRGTRRVLAVRDSGAGCR
jgi:tRNA(Ile)-lysidine synthase